MEAGAYLAGGVSIACVIALFVMGDRFVRIALALLVFLVVVAYALFAVYMGLIAR